MLEHDRDNQRKRLLRTLRSLVDCVMAQVDRDEAFADDLAQILLNGKSVDRSTKKTVSNKPDQAFNPILYLKDHGEQALQRELENRSDDELRAVLRFQRLRSAKELKKLNRSEMLRDVVNGSLAKLKQGLVIARVTTDDAVDQLQLDSDVRTKEALTDKNEPENGA